ncbi:inactive rhomboid protein 1-like [Limulus polyphemus]|uniref:Inactive rhomboid protein 1-like n=1 Tax=Limulus polyphemus TaxID=6850 RepID=A0ABM1T2G0_LIMPO|nr:inactive rhomboid protein 1-like [Limulus polyphemus]XP_022250067.1 inactive rhomboid protein 1-like [Limulus polyphemus]XP_022250068.1 inactive rhomboid protein 1-like [Limulus polyphemus]
MLSHKMEQTACEKDTDRIQHKQNVLKVTENPMDSGDNQSIVLQRPPAQHYSDEQRPVSGYQSMKQKALARSRSLRKYVQKETISFFGLNDHDDNEEKRWTNRRNRMLSRRCGGLKDYYETRREQLVSESVPTSSHLASQQGGDVVDHAENISTDLPHVEDEYTVRKDSVYKMTLNGLRYLSHNIRKKLSSSHSQNSRPVQRKVSYTTVGDDSVFFRDEPEISRSRIVSQSVGSVEENFFEKFVPTPEVITDLEPPSIRESVKPLETGEDQIDRPSDLSQGWYSSSVGTELFSPGPMQQLWKKIVSKSRDNSDRRQYGMGVVGKFFKRNFQMDHNISGGKGQGENIEDSRPYFTYWITTVQILISIISLAVYGFGPVGFHKTQRSSQVLVTRLSLEQVDYFEPDNFWIGPRAADLVHLGAKFTPCMRKDKNIFDAIKKDQDIERETACCVRNDQSGCVQTTRSKCSKIISSWKKWSKTNPGPPAHIQDPEQASSVGEWTFRRFSGSVCGQDPRYCEEPASAHPFEWPDDISKWPICKQPVHGKNQADDHMACEVIGRPCCVGIYGECRITTKEYCDFVRGFFHEEAALCSQVSCLDDVCGMIPFYNSEVPDQFYRLWTSLFLHAGIVHLFITIIIQFYFMRDLEKLTGPFRIGIVYIISGIAGNLASAIFVPYRAEVGPAGSQFGLLACIIAEVIHCWSELKQPGLALLRLLGVALVLFILGVLPWVDNYSHLFGFIFGFLLSYALLPFLSFGKYDRTRKIIIIVLCLLAVIILFLGLVVLFYFRPINECSFCKYFNCIPFTHDFCETQDISVLRKEEF